MKISPDLRRATIDYHEMNDRPHVLAAWKEAAKRRYPDGRLYRQEHWNEHRVTFVVVMEPDDGRFDP